MSKLESLEQVVSTFVSEELATGAFISAGVAGQHAYFGYGSKGLCCWEEYLKLWPVDAEAVEEESQLLRDIGIALSGLIACSNRRVNRYDKLEFHLLEDKITLVSSNYVTDNFPGAVGRIEIRLCCAGQPYLRVSASYSCPEVEGWYESSCVRQANRFRVALNDKTAGTLFDSIPELLTLEGASSIRRVADRDLVALRSALSAAETNAPGAIPGEGPGKEDAMPPGS